MQNKTIQDGFKKLSVRLPNMPKGISRKRKQFLSHAGIAENNLQVRFMILKFFHRQSDNATFNYIYLEDQYIKSC